MAIPFRLIVFTLGIAFLCLAPYGIQEVVLNVPEAIIIKFVQRSFQSSYGYSLSDVQLQALWGCIVSAMPVGAIAGCLAAGSLADRYGRRFSLFVIASLMSIAGSACMAASYYSNLFELLLAGRIVVGVTIGLVTSITPVYLVECSPVGIRGAIGNFHPFCYFFIMFLTFFLSLKVSLGQKHTWPWLVSLQGWTGLILLILYPWLPESPPYLYVKRKNPRACTEAIFKIQGIELGKANLKDTLDEFEIEVNSSSTKKSIFDVFKSHVYRKAAFLAFVIGAVRSCCGSGVIHAYSTELFLEAGTQKQVAAFSSVSLGLAFLPCLFSGYLVEKMGRRGVFLGGMAAVAVGWSIVFVARFFSDYPAAGIVSQSATIMTFTVTYPMGPGAIAWYLASELVPEQARAAVQSIAAGTIWAVLLITVAVYPVLNAAIDQYAILVLFVGPLVIAFVYLSFQLPETKSTMPSDVVKATDSKGQ